MPRSKTPTKTNGDGANLRFEATLWAADKLRNDIDAAEYKHVVLGFIILRFISDVFDERHAALVAAKADGADPEEPDEYRAANIFWVPKEARWADQLKPALATYTQSGGKGETATDKEEAVAVVGAGD